MFDQLQMHLVALEYENDTAVFGRPAGHTGPACPAQLWQLGLQ